ncbi:MAG TPA: hypothetical protein VF666_20160 [Pyrinomonadaceae bacterium]|jgi:hypothetical protein
MSEEAKSGDVLTTQLRVTHKDEGDYTARGIKLRLDDEDLTLLKSGKAIVVEVEPGHHRLRVDNTFHSKTVEFDVKAGEEVHYRIWNKRGFGSWMVEIFGAGPLYLAIERVEPIDSATASPTPPNSL